jgi:hypothetical protein
MERSPGSKNVVCSIPLAAKDSEQFLHRIIELIHHSFLERNNGIVSDCNALRQILVQHFVMLQSPMPSSCRSFGEPAFGVERVQPDSLGDRRTKTLHSGDGLSYPHRFRSGQKVSCARGANEEPRWSESRNDRQSKSMILDDR